MARPTRRAFLAGAAAASAALLAACSPSKRKAAVATSSVPRTGTIKDVKHVVILMQENRSFDHYYGPLAGVRGLGDKQALQFPNNTSVFQQPRSSGTLLPWRMDTSQTDAQDAADLDHSWAKTHTAWNSGAWNQWIAAKSEQTMGYFTRADLPWQYALADAFTICDAYHCSLQGPTTPNRLMHWTGTVDPQGKSGGPVIENPADYVPVYHWTTYPERLQAAGISWQVYANEEVGNGGYEHGWVGDYGDNPLWLFQQYHDALGSADPKLQDLAKRASLRKSWKPDSGLGQHVDHVLTQFIDDCANNTLPTVSWVVAPYLYCEHPTARPVDGAAYIGRMLKALWDNPTLWQQTAVIVNYDENDGYFDHVPPPFPPAGTADEYIAGLPIGLGPRVPAMVISPWSRGGWVNSQVFDHTSVLRFLEVVTGVAEPNISQWRRDVCGDLTSCFDFTSFDASVPALPDITKLTTQANAARSRPKPQAPTGIQAALDVETATRKHRPLPYQLDATVAVNAPAGTVTMTFTNSGRAAASILAYSNVGPFSATPILVPGGGQATFAVPVTGGHYDATGYGPNGFIRRCAGTVANGEPSVQASRSGTTLSLLLRNDAEPPMTFTLIPNDYGGQAQTISISGGGNQTVAWPSVDGWYDVTVAATPAFTYRFAGRIESG